MKLYYSDVLSPRKACAVAKYLQAPVEYVFLDLARGQHRTPDYLAINPNGKVPTLTDGERTLWEADAIICHLALRTGSDLWPQDARQVEIVRWFSWDLQHFTRHAGVLYFEHIIKARFGLGDPDPLAVADAQQQFRRYAAVLDAHLQGRRWLVGDRLSVADFAVAVTLPYAERARIPLEEFPRVRDWHGRLGELEAWREPFPDLVETA
jgi:glutathione S-transferase